MNAFRLSLLPALLALGGCATGLPSHLPPLPDSQHLAKMVKSHPPGDVIWDTPAVTISGQLTLALIEPESLKPSIAAQPVDLTLSSGATYADLAALMSQAGFPTVVTDAAMAKVKVNVPRLKGTMQELANIIQVSGAGFLLYQNGVYVLTPSEPVVVPLPQDEGLIKAVTTDLSGFGLKPVVSATAGIVTMQVKPSELRVLHQYLTNLMANGAEINLQVGVLNVSLNKDAHTGIDWTQFSMALGQGGGAALNSTGNSGLPGTGVVGSGTASTGTASSSVPAGTTPGFASATAVQQKVQNLANLAKFTGGTLGLTLGSQIFSLTGAFNFLETYGDATVVQNATLQAFSGEKVKLNSTLAIPYVSGVGVGAVGSTGASTTVGTASTSTANSGLQVTLTPAYDGFTNTVTVKADIELTAITGYANLSAGSQLGGFQQPIIQTQSFNSVLRLRPGETTVVGGVKYDSVSNSRSGLSFLAGKSYGGGNHISTNRNEMFVVVRPTIVLLGRPKGEGLPR